MTTTPDTSPRGGGKEASSSLLPQYGFESHTDIRGLIEDNHFLFRVYTPKERSPFFDDSEPFFIATRFDERVREAPDELRDWDSYGMGALSEAMGYEDVARHLTWTTRTESPLISANFSFSWSVWDALRRYHASMKKDIQIAVIDAHQVAHKAATAMELMQKDAPSKKDKEYWKWRRYALESQLVFVHGSIPGSAVYATIPLLAIVEKLPTYFLLNELDSARPADVAWDYKDKRSSYHAFCQLMSDRFMKLPSETRVRDTTAGAVRLAVAFLRPWFHSVVAEDFGRAVTTACELAFAIAHWPGRWWARGHDEVWTLIRALVHLLAEELREAHHVRVTKEVEKLEAAIHDLEAQVKHYEQSSARDEQDEAAGPSEEEERLQGVIAQLEAQVAHYKEEESARAEAARMQEIIDGLEEKVRMYEQERIPGTPSLVSDMPSPSRVLDSLPEYSTPGSPGYFHAASSYFTNAPDWPLTPPISPYFGVTRARSGSESSVMSELSIMPRSMMTTPPPMMAGELIEPKTPPQQRATPSMLPTPPSTLPRPRNRVVRMPTDPGELSSPFISPHGRGVGHARSMSLSDMHKAMSLSVTPDMLAGRAKSPTPSFASMAPDLSPLQEAPELPPLRGPVSFPRPLTPESSVDSRQSSRAPSRQASLYDRQSTHERQGSWPERKPSVTRHARSRSSSIISMGSRPVSLMEAFDRVPSHAVMEDDVLPEVAGIEQMIEAGDLEEAPRLEDSRHWVERPRSSSVLLAQDAPRFVDRLASVTLDLEERELASRRMDAPLSAVTEEGPGLDSLDLAVDVDEAANAVKEPLSANEEKKMVVDGEELGDTVEAASDDEEPEPVPRSVTVDRQTMAAAAASALLGPSVRAVLPIIFVPVSLAVHAVHRAIYNPIRAIEVVPELAAAITTAAQALSRVFAATDDESEPSTNDLASESDASSSTQPPSVSTPTDAQATNKLPIVVISSPSSSKLSLEEAWTLVDELVPVDDLEETYGQKEITSPGQPLMIGWEGEYNANVDNDVDGSSRAEPDKTAHSRRPRRHHHPRPPLIVESVSYVAAGFLLGAVFAVSLMSAQRRATVVYYGSLT